MDKFLLRSRREALGLTALQLANQARCPIEAVIHTEFGFPGWFEGEIRRRLAAAYGLQPDRFNRLARHAEARMARRLGRQRPGDDARLLMTGRNPLRTVERSLTSSGGANR